MIGQQMGFGDAALGSIFRKNWHERLAERTFSEQPAEKIWDAPSGNKRILHHASAKGVRHDDIEYQPRYAR